MFIVKNDFKNANISRTIRFNNDIFEKLSEVANENDVSFNLLVLQCCKYALENMKSDSKEDKE